MNQTDARAIAQLANTVHPDWPISSLMTLLGKHQHRPAQHVAIAMAWIAFDPASKTPGRLNEPGPWWQATQVGHTPQPPSSRDECPRHPGNYAGRCHGCAADRLTGTDAGEDKPLTPDEARERIQQARQQITTRPTPAERTDQ